MTNNLIFNNGATLPICPADAADAPRMMGGGWRQWHVEGTCADAAAALESGVVRREYESVTGVDEDGNPLTEVLVEDISAYVVPGSVCDHMDGTCTVFARRQTELEREKDANRVYAESLNVLGVDTDDTAASTEARLSDIWALSSHADMTGEDKAIVDMPPMYCARWEPGMELKQGQLVEHNAVKYLLLQNTTAMAHYPPDMPDGAMLSVYKPYQGREHYTWLYGEYIEVGFTRYEGAVLYRAYQDPGANIFPPSQVPACWEVVEQ